MQNEINQKRNHAKRNKQEAKLCERKPTLNETLYNYCYYYYDLFTVTDNTGTYIFMIQDYKLIYMLDKSSVLLLSGLAQ